MSEIHLWRLTDTGNPLRSVLAVYLGVEPGQIRLRQGEHGKPYLEGGERGLEFNLSHSGDLALVALSGEHAVGVDVERLRPKRAEDYYRRWACREAEVKCQGIGLLGDRQPNPDPIAVQPLDVGPGYAAAIAVATGELPPLRGWTFDPAHQKTTGRVS